ncbi:MAG TPA: ABC transporter permease [Candidatus Saccharimonadales bacterium]|nr:ABC transporter permease [Candidatus Saccharimonadales bacterium]
MRFIDYITMALRNILRQKLRSALTIFAVVIGATSVTIMLALVTGIKDFFYSQFQSTGQLQQVAVTPQADLNYEEAQPGRGGNNCSDCTKLTDAMATQIKGFDHVVGLSRTASVYVFESMTYNDQKLRMQSTQAYDPNGVIQHEFLAGQEFNSDDGTGKIMISQDYADKMGFKGNYAGAIGKQVTLNSGANNYFTGEGATLADPVAQFLKCQNGGCDNNQDNNANRPPESHLTATIVGVVADQSTTVYFPLKWASGLLENRQYQMTKADQEAYNQANDQWNRGGRRGAQPAPHFTLQVTNQLAEQGYPSFVVKVDQTSNADAVAAKIRTLKVGAVTAQSFIKDQLTVFKIISFILGGIGGIALLVAAIGVINTMIMSILERTREIGVMRAVGAKRSTVSWLFTIEASLLGFWGGVFGIAVGYGLTQVANIFINKQFASNSVKAHNIIGLPLWLIVAVIAATTVVGLLAGLYPARRAAKLDPVEALHYE